jgi:preprotein translocase subunit YajC
VLGTFTLLAQKSTSGGSSATGLLVTLVLMGAVFYFLLIRPQQRRARAQRQLMSSIAVGDDVVTIGGVYGTVKELDDDEAVLEVATGVEIRFLRSAIARKLSYDEDEEYEGAQAEEKEEEAGDQS